MFRRSRKTSRSRGTSGLRQGRKLGEGFLAGRPLRFECLEVRRLLSLQPIISEVDPGNKSGIVDTLGNAADWVEIYNPDPTAAANLSGWSLYYAKTQQHYHAHLDVPQQRGPWSRRVPRGLLRFDGNDGRVAENAVGELDTGFNLSKDGATVELINASTAVVSSLTYPSLEFRRLLRPDRGGRGNGSRGGGGHGELLCPDEQRWATPGTSPVSTPPRGHRAHGPGVRQQRSRFRHARCTGRTSGSAAWRRRKRSSARPPTSFRQSAPPRAI